MNKLSIAAVAVTSLITGTSVMASETHENDEKCYGVARAGQNDCGNSLHGCGGKAKTDSQKNEWMYVPKGLCKKLAGSSDKEVKVKAKKK